MDKFIPYEKLSKKKQKEYDSKRRNTWGNLKPVTRKVENGKAYNRKRARMDSLDSPFVPFDFIYSR